MPYVAATTVQLQDDIPQAERVRMLRETIVPKLKGLPGFRNARFLRSADGTTGIAAVMFDNEADAKAGLDAMTTDRPAGAPPIVNTAIYEVVLEA